MLFPHAFCYIVICTTAISCSANNFYGVLLYVPLEVSLLNFHPFGALGHLGTFRSLFRHFLFPRKNPILTEFGHIYGKKYFRVGKNISLGCSS